MEGEFFAEAVGGASDDCVAGRKTEGAKGLAGEDEEGKEEPDKIVEF